MMIDPATESSSIADALDRCAELLEIQRADPHRVRAYRIAAGSVRSFPGNVAEVARSGGREALERLHGVGKSIAAAIEQLVASGRWPLLEQLEGEASPELLLETVPGIGEKLARRIHSRLGIDTLEALELAAHDGRLARIAGFGPRRLESVRLELAALLAHNPRISSGAAEVRQSQALDAPSVAGLLALDTRYRRLAEQGALHLIAPRRFNPRGVAWLPILHDELEGFHVHALFSNSALAHKLGRTRDWLIIYHERDGHTGQHTVVTEQHGPLQGQRVVRGRERESAEYHAHGPPAAHHVDGP